MMTCASLTDLLLDYELGDLEPSVRDEVREHFGLCPTCRVFAATYAAVGPLVERAFEIPVDDALQAELEAACLAMVKEPA
jgi:anti-sigma factor RsiW